MKPERQHASAGLVGQRDLTVLDDGRIKLPADVLRMLQSLGLRSRKLCPGRVPLTTALVLVPAEFWRRWKEALLSRFPLLRAHPGATAYLDPFKPITWDFEGRISLPAPASHHASIARGVSIILIGKDYYVELWTEEEFKRVLADCEAALARTDLRQSNGNGPVQECRTRTQGDATL